MKTEQKPAAKPTTRTKSGGFTAEERAAMRDRVKEIRSANAKADGESEVLAKIKEMQPSDRAMAERIHAIVKATAPDLTPRTWYGMPAYGRDGAVLLFFRDARKFKTRYATLGFSHHAKLDDGTMWPTDFALTKLTGADEKRIAALIKQATS
jgi:uncharacterized protein YdhG (YjbR/CyaY superfamily)